MLTTKEDDLRETDSLSVPVHHTLMVFWTAGTSLFQEIIIALLIF